MVTTRKPFVLLQQLIKTYPILDPSTSALVLRHLFEASCEASSVVIYTSLIDGCYKRGSFDAAKRLFDRKKGGGVSPNKFTYTVMISGYFSNGFPTLGFEMYDEMKQSGVCPNLYTCNVLISECCREQDFCFAFQPVDEMSQKGILSNIVTYNTFIGGFCKQSKVKDDGKLAGDLIGEEMSRDVDRGITMPSLPSEVCTCSFFVEMAHQRLAEEAVPVSVACGGGGAGGLRRRRRRRLAEGPRELRSPLRNEIVAACDACGERRCGVGGGCGRADGCACE
ncbi:hypothetical protein ZIOFF_004330 [Zingiber officinale]|uniref:Pentatricopeptide repeat-containing protein n=1 Tax=Zingiber officinale TaxID=94328 RepID=A0A8J5MAT1_ZINOF|nr:hypothetical protein ZIOFF_004330 [Zingiber officinale]